MNGKAGDLELQYRVAVDKHRDFRQMCAEYRRSPKEYVKLQGQFCRAVSERGVGQGDCKAWGELGKRYSALLVQFNALISQFAELERGEYDIATLAHEMGEQYM